MRFENEEGNSSTCEAKMRTLRRLAEFPRSYCFPDYGRISRSRSKCSNSSLWLRAHCFGLIVKVFEFISMKNKFPLGLLLSAQHKHICREGSKDGVCSSAVTNLEPEAGARTVIHFHLLDKQQSSLYCTFTCIASIWTHTVLPLLKWNPTG